MEKQPFYEFAPYSEVDEFADWSRQVKIKGGRVCEFPECGQIDQKLLESHHIKPKAEFPELDKDINNGECLCIYHHAVKHWDNEVVRNKILARLAIILYLRYYDKVNKQESHRANAPFRSRANDDIVERVYNSNGTTKNEGQTIDLFR